MAGKKAVVRGHGDVGKGCAMAPRTDSRVVHVTKSNPICVLQACA